MMKSKYIAFLLLGLLVIGVTGGAWTPNQFIYKPSLGARGAAEKETFDAGMDRIDTRLGKEIWVGDPAYGATLQAAVAAIGEINQVILRVPAGTHNVTADLSIPANVSLKAERGAILSIASSKTLTLNGSFDAGLYQVFSCAGTGTVVFGNGVPRVYPQWFGAVGDNSTDDTTAINQAATAARASGCKRIALPACAGHQVTAQLDLTGLSIEGDGPIYSTHAGTRVKCGGFSGTTGRADIKLRVDGEQDWSNGSIINIQVTGYLWGSVLDLASRHGTVGILVNPGANSIAYNTITLRDIHYCKVGLEVSTSSPGWANENLVLNGSFNNGSSTGAECCVKLDGGITQWTFIKPAFEYLDGTAVIFSKASYNHFHDVRYEYGANCPIAQFNDGANENIITLGYCNHFPFTWNTATASASPNGTAGNDVRMSGDQTLHRLTDTASFSSAYNDGTYLHVPGFEVIELWSGAVSRKNQFAASGLGLVDGHGGAALKKTGSVDYVIGITVNFYDTLLWGSQTKAKKLYVKHRMLDDTGNSNLYIKCYDSSGNVLSGSATPYVQGNQWQAVSDYYSIFFSGTTQALIFHPSVAKAVIGVNDTTLTGLEIYAPYQADGYLSYTGPKELPGVLYAANAPTKWHFQVGEKVFNDAPAAGAAQGWVCIKRTDTTLSANASGGATTITVADASAIANGDIIGVKLNTGLYHFTTVNGAPSGSTVTLTAAIPGSGVVANSGNAVVANLWRAMPNL
jgi:hypothetical protein